MSDMEKNQSAACDGDCTSCGSSCGFGESDATVTLIVIGNPPLLPYLPIW